MNAVDVAKRLIEAFEIDGRGVRVSKPKEPGSAHPEIFRSREEIAEVEEARRLAGIEEGPRPVRPSREEIASADEAFAWLPAVAVVDRAAYEAARAWAKASSYGADVRKAAQKLDVSPNELLRRAGRAFTLIAANIQGDHRVAVS